jgi:hypothetical protein
MSLKRKKPQGFGQQPTDKLPITNTGKKAKKLFQIDLHDGSQRKIIAPDFKVKSWKKYAEDNNISISIKPFP